MRLVQAFLIALSMYSKIPVPRVSWSKPNMRYAMCFFPVVGIITGGIVWLAGGYLLKSGFGKLFFSVMMTLIPVVINGGIHLDGFMDTVDAICSYGDREKKLEILKDPHSGAFAMMGLAIYFLLSLALWSEVRSDMLPVIGLGYVLSRGLSGLSVVTFKAAKDSGLAYTFKSGADRTRTGIVMSVWILLGVISMLVVSPLFGGIAVLISGLIFLYYRLMSERSFGGITGDLAGYFLELCELGILMGVVIGGRI